MSQIRPKQIKLNNQGDLIVGSNNGNGSILPRGENYQALYTSTSSVTWTWVSELRTSTSGNLVLIGNSSVQDPTNYLSVTATPSGNAPVIAAQGGEANISILFQPKGTGELLAPVSYTANIQSNNALVTKEYVDSSVAGLDWKNSVKAATTSSSDLTGYTYNPTNEPNGLVWTNVTSPSFDGVTINDGDRVLIKDAPDARGNGLFYYDATNNAFVRTPDADNTGSSSEVSDGLAVFVEQGTTNASTAWVLTQPNGTATLGTDNLIFTQFAGTNLYVAGSGLSLTGNVFSINESNTIGVVTNNVVVKSNNVSGNVLISTGNLGEEAYWGQLDLSNQNSITGILEVQYGGTGLSTVSAGHILVGTGGSALTTLAPSPATTNSLAYVLQTNASGNNVLFNSLTLNQLANVSAPSPVQGQLLVYDGTEWVNVSADTIVANEDKFVKITSNDDTAGYLDDKLAVATSGALTKTILSAGTGERLELSVNYDNTTIIADNNNLSVGGGTSAQVLIGQGINAPATWLSPANTSSDFNLIYDKDFGRVHYRPYREIEQIEIIGGGLFATPTFKGARLIFVEGDSIDIKGVVGGSAINIQHNLVLTSSLYTPVTADPADKLVFFDLSNNHIPNYMEIGTFLSNYNIMSVTGSGLVVSINGSAVTRNVVSNTSADRTGIEVLNGNGQNGDITIGLNIESLSAESVTEEDYFVVYRPSLDKNVKVALSSVFNSTSSANFKWTDITDGVNTLSPDSITDTLTITGSGIGLTLVPATDSIELTLDIPHLPDYTPTSARNLSDLSIAVFNSADSNHYETKVSDILSVSLQTLYASANATGAVNETFTNFFADTNVDDNSVVVYFNGIALKQSGWTRSGTDLTLVDSVNGYGTDPGDVITAYYRLI